MCQNSYELPLWLHYERGGGQATKLAARNQLKRKVTWHSNIFRTTTANYETAGGNGAAMRTLPISLAQAGNPVALLEDTLANALITHGHPRGIIGPLVLACTHHFLLSGAPLNLRALGHYIKEHLTEFLTRPDLWPDPLQAWLEARPSGYLDTCMSTLEEVLGYLRLIPNHQNNVRSYYESVGALSRATKGSATSTVACAIFLLFNFQRRPEEAIFMAANVLGSDTDTIACMTGGLVGLYVGLDYDEELLGLSFHVQDQRYLKKLGQHLFDLQTSKAQAEALFPTPEILPEDENSLAMSKQDGLLRVLGWEIDLHELFWDIFDEGDLILHPVMGLGHICSKAIYPLPKRTAYDARVFEVHFDIGQTAYFHSRVSNESLKVEQSLGDLVRKELAVAG